MLTDRIEFVGVRFDRLTMEEVLDRLSNASAGTPYSYVVTPNVDHVVRLNDNRDGRALQPFYENAGLCLCDSRVLKLLARLHGISLTLVAGSDLTARLLREVVQPDDRIAIIGGTLPLLERLKRLFPHVDFTQHIPPMGLRNNVSAQRAAADFVSHQKARFTFIAVGSPQQEIIAAAVSPCTGAGGTALCVGAALDFVVKLQSRAPRFLQLLGLEWAYRLIRDPRRMWRRYLVEGPRVFILAARYRRTSSALEG